MNRRHNLRQAACTLAGVLFLASAVTGCVSAGERARQSTLVSEMEATEYTQDCETLAARGADLFREKGYALPGDKDDDSIGISFSAGGSSETSMESSSSFSFSSGGGGGAKEAEAEAEVEPAAVVNTLPNDGRRYRLECYLQARGSTVKIIKSTKSKSDTIKTRDYETELALLNMVDAEKAGGVKASMDQAEANAEKE